MASKGVFSINIQSKNQFINEIFEYIEASKLEFGIEDYTVSSTSLEDVFLKINNKSSLNDMKYYNKDLNEINDNMVFVAGFLSQLISHLKRGLFPIWRNKTLFFVELISGLGIVYIFIFFFSKLIMDIDKSKINFIEVLEENRNYIYEFKNGYFKNSDIYKSSYFITLKKIKNRPNDINDFIDKVYKQSFANIGKGSIAIKKINDSLFEVYNTEVQTYRHGYLYANIILIVSAFLKNEYGIDASLFYDMEIERHFYNKEDLGSLTIVILVIVCLVCVFGYTIYLGGIANQKIKERINNIKHLLYLSGNNPWSYWIGFFIVDFIKLFIFSLLLILPIFYVNNSAKYFLINMIGICISSLPFIYVISFLCSKEDSGTKFVTILLFAFIISFLVIFFIFANNSYDDYRKFENYIENSLTSKYNFTIFDLTPITSLILSFGRLLISYYMNKNIEEHSYFYEPSIYLYTSFMVQSILLAFYTLLLILLESGYLRRFLHFIKVNCFMNSNNYIFSEEKISEDFVNYNNNINDPLLEMHAINDSISSNSFSERMDNNMGVQTTIDPNNIINTNIQNNNFFSQTLPVKNNVILKK